MSNLLQNTLKNLFRINRSTSSLDVAATTFDAIQLVEGQQKRIAELEKERDEISLAQFVYAYFMDQHRNPIDLYHWLIKWNHLKALKEQGE